MLESDTIEYHHNLRLGDSKAYYKNELLHYTKHIKQKNPEVCSVHFGKQDIRGVPSICHIDDKHRVGYQKHFNNSKELLHYVIGYNAGVQSARSCSC